MSDPGVQQSMGQPSNVKKTVVCASAYFRRLNAVTWKDVYLLPRIDDLLDQLNGKQVFSTLDARTGYWQIQMHKASPKKTAFIAMDGLYEFCVMPLTRRISEVDAEDLVCGRHDHVLQLNPGAPGSPFPSLRPSEEGGTKAALREVLFWPTVLYLGHIISATDRLRVVATYYFISP